VLANHHKYLASAEQDILQPARSPCGGGGDEGVVGHDAPDGTGSGWSSPHRASLKGILRHKWINVKFKRVRGGLSPD